MAPPRCSSSCCSHNPIIICKSELLDLPPTISPAPAPLPPSHSRSSPPQPRPHRPVRIIHIKTPKVIKTHPSLFRSLVQQLTGNHSSSFNPPTIRSFSSSSESAISPVVVASKIDAVSGAGVWIPCSGVQPPPMKPCFDYSSKIAPPPPSVPMLPCPNNNNVNVHPPAASPPIITMPCPVSQPPIHPESFDSAQPPLPLPLPPQRVSPPHLPLLLTPHAFMAQQSLLLLPFPDDATPSPPNFAIHRDRPIPPQANLFVSAPDPLQPPETSHTSSQLAFFRDDPSPVSPHHPSPTQHSLLSACFSSESSVSFPSLRRSREWLVGECATDEKGAVVLSPRGEYEMDRETSNGSDVDMVGSVSSNDGEEEEELMKRTWKQKMEGEAILWRSEESSSPSLICGGDNQSNISCSSLSSDSSGGSCGSTDEDSTEWDIIWGLLSASPLMEASHSLPPLLFPLQEINTSIPMVQPHEQITLNRRPRQIPARFL